jgi:hypothetical protein
MSLSVIGSRHDAGLSNFLQQRRQDPPAPTAASAETPTLTFQRDAAKLDAGTAAAGARRIAQSAQMKTDLSSLATVVSAGTGSPASADQTAASSNTAANPSSTTAGDPSDLDALLQAVQSGTSSQASSLAVTAAPSAVSPDLDALLSAVRSGR